MSQSYFKDASWEAQRIVANDSYACPNPLCGVFNPKGFTACVTCGCKFTFEAVLGPSKVARPGSVGDGGEVTAKEMEDYGLRIAKHAVRTMEKRVFIYKDNSLLWKQVVRCLDWRRKWDLVWTKEDNLNKLQQGGSRWRSGEQWGRPTTIGFNQMRRKYPGGIPGSAEFYAKHQDRICDHNLTDHAHLATVYTVGNLCDRLEMAIIDLIPNLPQWLKTGANSARVNKIYDEEPKRLLAECGETLTSMVAHLKVRTNAPGDEKARHATWLDQAKAGAAMTKEQVDEIRHAIKKGRPHLAKKLQSETPPVAVATTGPRGASSSGLRCPEGIRRVPSRNPPVREPAPHQGAVKRVFSDRGSDDPFAPTVRRHREEQAKAAPSVRRNPNVDVRYGDMPPARVTSSPPPRAVPMIGTPPGDWIPGVERKTAAARAKAARAAAAALPYADDRRRDPPAFAVRERSLPPRRGPSRGPPEELSVHPDNPLYVWSHLQKMWVLREEPAAMTYRGARSRSPPPRHDRDDQYRVTW